ncbi:TipJ family phage tail tip protein [Pseudomonas monteilii]|uniref:TipJ family phage tail tip protein n=1 Tax=Pseudomonas monteilii TaxID=76759 RepID=UPI003EB8983F
MGPADHVDITGAKGGSSKPKTQVEAPDSLQSTNIGKLLIAVGEGEFDGEPTDRDIYLDNTPIMDANGSVNFPGVKWEWRPGSVEQEYIQGIPSVENETTVNVELRSDNPFTRALSNTQLSAVRVRMSWPRLAQQDSSGNTNGYRIEYAIDIATDGGAYVESHLGAVDGKTTNGYQRSVRVNLPKATSGWMLRVRRITPNANSGTVADMMSIAGYTEIIDQKLRYPNTALLYIEFDAQQFQNIPSVTVKCKAKRWPVPSNYDPLTRTYTGVWDGTFKQAWTNNPAFATYGICVEDRFGLGKRIKSWMVDKWEMYRIAQYCDQQVTNGQGGLEPRFLCDMNLQGRAEAWTLLRDLSAIYRGMVYWTHGSLFMQADMPRAQDIDYVFTRANVIDGEFVYGGAERNTHYSRALVSYDNPANNYDTDVIPVTDNALQRRYRDRPVEISAIGCTRASEAQRRGKWALLSNSQDRTVTFKTGMEGRIPLPGYVIPVADELVAGRPNGGRISAAAGRVVTLDRDTPIKAGDRLILNLPNGTAQARTVQSVAGRAVTVTTAYGVQPEPELQWAIDYDDLAVQLFRVLKTTRTQEGEYEITALEFNPSKFAAIDTGAKLDERPISVIPVTTVQLPASVTLTSAYAVDQGIAVSTMTISWPAVQGAVAYDVEWRKDNGNWVRVQRTGAASVDVVGIYGGAYLARVRAVSSFDITSTWRDSTLTQLKGKEGLPPAVAYLTTTPLVYGTALSWGFPAGAEDTERTEIWQSATTSRDGAIKLGDFAYPQAEHEIHGLAAGVSFFYWARLVDRSGNIGPWYPAGVGVNGQSSSNQSEYEEYFKDKISNGALYPALREEISLISGPPTQTGSVAQRLAAEAVARAQAIAAEVVDRNQAIAAETQARTQAISDEAAARAQGLLSEAQARGAAITSEAQARQSADDSLSQKIDTVTASAGNNAAAIQAEATARANADSALGQRIDTVATSTAANTAAIGNETTARTNADTALAAQIATLRAESGGFDSALNYGFASTVEGWTGTRCTLAVENGRLIVTNDGTGAAYLGSPVVSLKGRDHDRIRCRITRRAGSGWNGQVTYVTANHASSTSYRKVIPDPGLAVGQTVVLEWDMSQLTNGGSDWTDSTVTRFYLWISSGTTDVFEIDWIAVGQIAPSASVASVVDERTARISGDEANASAILGLSSSLQTTNGNVTAAQQAAQAASDKAGGKGEVIYSSTEPATDKRLAQNLWIDTTGAANTPKRWTGSAWVAVTDKVATDAAAAAASALAQVASKADASALQALQTTVTNQGNTLTAQGTSITQIKASIGQQPDNLILRGSFEDGLVDPWSGDARITNISAHPSAGKGVSFYTNSFCGIAANVLTAGGEQFDLSADIWPSYMTSGQTTRLQMQFFDKAGTNLGYFNAFSVVASATGFKSYAGRITAPAGAVSARFVTRTEPADGTGRSLWCNIVARRVTAADTANADAISTIGASVTQQGNTLTSQGQALTQLQSSVGSIGGSGANLLSDEYSWLTSTTLPALISSSVVTKAGVAVPEADSGFGYQVGGIPTAGHFLMLSPTNNAAGYNVRIEPGVYLVSMYVRGSAAGSMRASLFDGTGRISGDVPYTTTRTRITLPITITDSTRAAITLYPNRTGVADLTLVIDSVMIEKRIGESNTPSPFVAGPSARAVGGQATAISQMDTVVKQQGTAIAAQASRLDGLYVQVNPEMEGDSTGLAGATGGLVGVWTEQSARIEDGIAIGRQVETVQAQMGQTNASVQQVSEVVAGVDGRVSALSSWKTETNANGKKVATGIVQGSDGSVGEILLSADRVAIINGLNGPEANLFVFQNGQLFLNSALINQAFIQSLVVGMTLRSQAVNAQGLPLIEINLASGSFTVRGQDASGSTLLNNGGLYVYDANGIERAAVGRLT